MKIVRRTRLLPVLCILISLVLSGAAPAQQPGDIEKRIDALLAQMTLEEKLGQLQQLDGHADGKYRPEHVELVRKGLLGSPLNVRGAKHTNELQKVAGEPASLKISTIFSFYL